MANIHLNKGTIMYIVRFKYPRKSFPGDLEFVEDEIKVHAWSLRQYVGRKDANFRYITHFPCN